MPPSAFLLFLTTARSGGPRDTKAFTEICGCIDWEPALLQSRAHPHVPVSWMELALWGSWDWQLIIQSARTKERLFRRTRRQTPNVPRGQRSSGPGNWNGFSSSRRSLATDVSFLTAGCAQLLQECSLPSSCQFMHHALLRQRKLIAVEFSALALHPAFSLSLGHRRPTKGRE